ncbi:hypothetical protein HYDPIDRAFT_190627 [Hydnomerulius pinastri MD-312]|uniref:Uncharacterized protein n=1 Tax=Hydnomerulius pinastri MD-312 TaxID=994086 RepID=A0A0C9VN39_9AGAM|nr:hypothetical protein HYDPIDRAFT_190627 [Hydnomerulius pinastri MD-312]
MFRGTLQVIVLPYHTIDVHLLSPGSSTHVARGLQETAASSSSIYSTYASMESGNTRRKQTLLSLIDVLTEMDRDKGLITPDPGTFQTSRLHTTTTLDEKLQIAGAEQFLDFEKRVENFDKELRNFANASRQLGSSVGILSSAFTLRERLSKILFLFRENAASLFPRRILRQPREALTNPNIMHRRRNWRGPPPPERLVVRDDLAPETFPAQLEGFAIDVAAFLKCLNEFEEFTDDTLNQTMQGFESDLNYWASCLLQYKSQFRSPAVQRYAHDLTTEIGDHIDNIATTLAMFIEIGLPTIRFHQQHAATNLLNVSKLSIFFGVVDATLLQYSYSMTANAISDCVNAFWFSSLVFSIAAGANGLLGLTWKQSIYRSPSQRVPWWVLIWMKGSPLVFLVISVACFSAGLVLFAYSSGQGRVTSATTSVLTVVASLGLVFISGWFALERWTYAQHGGQKWLEEVISDVTDDMASRGVVRAPRNALGWCGSRIAVTRSYFNPLSDWLFEARKSEDILPFVGTKSPSVFSESTERPGSFDGHKPESESSGNSAARVRFVNAVRSVIKLQSTTRSPTRPGFPRRDSWWQTSMAASPEELKNQYTDPGMTALRGARVSTSIEQLKALELSQEFFVHSALVRHVQFSPNGKYLATSSWDKTAVIFREGLVPDRTLMHVQGFVGQVAWSPNGRVLLTRFTRGIKVWSEDGVFKKLIDRVRQVQAIVWLPRGDGNWHVPLIANWCSFVDCVFELGSQWTGEKRRSCTMEAHQSVKILDTYNFDHMRISNITVTSDGVRLIGVGPSIPPKDGPQPTRHAKVEKRIIVYNMQTKRKERYGFCSQTPLFDAVRDVIISRKSSVVLVSFEQAAPQLWKLEVVKGRDRPSIENTCTSRLTLRHTFVLNVPVSIAGPCYFGGNEDQFVFCAGKGLSLPGLGSATADDAARTAGDIHIWDRETAAVLRYLRPPNMPAVGNLTCIGWNNATDHPMMLATGSHNGTVQIWSTNSVRSQSEGSMDDER